MIRTVIAVALTLAANGAAAAAAQCPLRVAIVRGNAAQARAMPDGSFKGVAVDIAQRMADRWGRRLAITAATPTDILAQLERREIDLGFLAINPVRRGTVTYSQPYMLVRQTVMVRGDSPLRSVAELDRAGTKIGANGGDSVAMYLSRTLKVAGVQLSADIALDEAAQWLRDGTVAAFAGNRQRLSVVAEANGLRLLPDDLTTVPQGVAVRQDDEKLLEAVEQTLGEMRASGSIARAVRRNGTQGVIPAPVAKSHGAAPAVVPPCPAPL